MASPVITYATPAPGSTIRGVVNVQAQVTDDLGVRDVTARVGSLTLPGRVGGGGSASQSFTFNTAYRKRPRTGMVHNIGYLKPGASIRNFTNFKVGSAPDKYDCSAVRFMLNLDGYNQTDHLPSSVNTWLDNYFAAMRNGGVSCAFGVVYYDQNQPSPYQPEPALTRIRNHLGDLLPTLLANIDIIDEFFAAIAGDWGEQNFWRNGRPSFTGNSSQAFLGLIRTALHEIWGGLNRHFMWRNLRFLFEQPETPETGWYTRGANASEAYRFNLPIARDAIHVDAAMNLPDELSTYYPYGTSPTSVTIQKQKQYMREVTLYTPTYREGGGGFNLLNPPSGYTKRGAIDYLKHDNINKFNYDGYTHIDLWLAGSSPENDEWRRTLGYNLHMRSYNISVDTGTVTVSIQWENMGSTGLHYHNQLYLELGSQLIKLSDDIRLETPRGGETLSRSYTVARPSGLTAGTYAIRFWMPHKDVQASTKYTGTDAEKAQKRAAFAIPISSNGITFNTATGRNETGRSLTITNSSSSSVYNFTFDTTLVTDGTQLITVRATDFDGNETLMNVSVIVDNVADDITNPTLTWSYPTEGIAVAGEVQLSVNATDADSGMQRVEFYVNDFLIGTDFNSPFRATWDTALEINGAHNLKAVAYDQAGNSTERSITALVSNTGNLDGLNVIRPANGESITGTYQLQFTKSGSVSTVTILVDGVEHGIVTTSLAAPTYIYNLDTTTFDDGQHVIEFRAAAVGVIVINRTVFIDNGGGEVIPDAVYSMKVFTPLRLPSPGRSADPFGLVATYTNADFYFPDLTLDKRGNVLAGAFQAIPKNQDDTQRLDIRKDDIVQFYVGTQPIATALIDIPVHPQSKGAGIMESVETYEVYTLKNALELLDKTTLPDVEYINDTDPNTGNKLAQKRKIYELATLLIQRHSSSAIRLWALSIFSNKPHADFYAPGSTLREALQALIQASGREVDMWIDGVGRLWIETKKNTLGVNIAKIKKRLLPPEPGRLITKVNLQVFGDNDFQGYQPVMVASGGFEATETNTYKPGLVNYSYADLAHEIYASELTRAIAYGSVMELPPSQNSYTFLNHNGLINDSHVRRLFTNPDVDAKPVKNVVGSSLSANPSIDFYTPVNDASVYGIRLKYSFLEDEAGPTVPYAMILKFWYMDGNEVNGGFKLELPFTGTRTGGVEDAGTEIKNLSIRFIPPRGKKYTRIRYLLEMWGLTPTLGGDPQAILYNFHPLRIDKRPGGYLEGTAKAGIVLPQPDPGEITISASDDPRAVANKPIPGLVLPVQRLNLRQSGAVIETKIPEAFEISYDNEFKTVIRWGRRDVDSDLSRAAKQMKNKVLQETNAATLLAVRRAET